MKIKEIHEYIKSSIIRGRELYFWQAPTFIIMIVLQLPGIKLFLKRKPT